jgi:hypothetical protein
MDGSIHCAGAEAASISCVVRARRCAVSTDFLDAHTIQDSGSAEGTMDNDIQHQSRKDASACRERLRKTERQGRRLYCLDTSDIATANTWIHSCAVLHNLCELHSDAPEEDVLKRIKHRIELEKALAEEMRENQNDNADNGCDRDEDESVPVITDSEKRDGLAMIMYDKWLKSRK